MADAFSKVTIFLESTGGPAPTGWTETYWSTQGNLDVAVDLAVKKYVPKRAALLGVGASIKAVRASTIPPNRLSSITFVSGKAGDPSLFTTSPEDDYDPTQVDLLVRVTDVGGHRRQLWVGGLPDSQTDQLKIQGVNGAFINSPAWKQFVQGILDNNFCIRSKNTPPATGYTAQSISTVVPIMIRNRKRGRPFFLFRGRRLA